MNCKVLMFALAILLSACDEAGRIVPRPEKDIVPVTAPAAAPVFQRPTTTEQVYQGDFRSRNFVEGDFATYQDLIVILTCGKTQVYPNGYEGGQDTTESYFVIRPDILIFFNTKPDCTYWIKVSE